MPEIPLVELVASAYTYEEYKQFTQRLIKEGRTTGEDQSEAMQEYTRINLQRMNRWDKTTVVSESLKAKMDLQQKTGQNIKLLFFDLSFQTVQESYTSNKNASFFCCTKFL